MLTHPGTCADVNGVNPGRARPGPASPAAESGARLGDKPRPIPELSPNGGRLTAIVTKACAQFKTGPAEDLGP